jgi:hypothetical protein
MSFWALVWCLIFAAAALAFFVTAAVIAVAGARDLRDLLSRSRRS